MSKTHPTIPEGDLGFDAISYAREIVSTPSHHDADEFSACARETLSAMLAAWDRLRERHDTLFRNHAFLMATKIPPTVISIPAPPADAAPLTSDFHTSCDWCKRDIPNACYAVLCSDCDRRGNTALFAPPADAATEALRYCEEVFQHNEINRVDGEEIADRALVLIRRALSTPAPAPSTDPWRACGCADPDNCEHIFRDPAPSAPAPAPDTIEHPCGCYAPDGDVCWKHAAPTAHALRRCEQPEVKK